MLRKYWRPILWRWHKRLGLTLILLLLWLSVTGIFLNHTDDFELAERPLGYSLLLQLYGIDAVKVTTFISPNGLNFSQTGDHLYLGAQRLSHCATDRFSLVALEFDLLLASCGNEMLLLSAAGELVERIGAAYNVPQPLSALGLCGEEPCIQSGSDLFAVDVDALVWPKLQPQEFVATSPTKIPEALKEEIAAQWVSAEVNWQRFMLDLHAGRTFGLGPWLMDAVALLIIVLSMTGLGIWLAGRKRR